jgi:septal ring factor EnvC (AmiA/AmiB activator)
VSVPAGDLLAPAFAASPAPLLTAVAAFVTAVAGSGVAIYGVVRSSKGEEAKRQSDAQQVGLDYLRDALKVQAEQLVSTRTELADTRRDLATANNRIDVLEDQLHSVTRERDRVVAELAAYRRRGAG